MRFLLDLLDLELQAAQSEGRGEIISTPRVITANQKEALIEQGLFREDLYFRINVFPLHCPPLSSRREDIPLLATTFLKRFAAAKNKSIASFADKAIDKLLRYSFPGNIRELQNVIERAAILARDKVVPIAPHLVHSGINPATETADTEPTASNPNNGDRFVSLAENEAHYIRRVLEHTGWMIAGKGGAAEILDLPASTLRSRMKKLGVERAD